MSFIDKVKAQTEQAMVKAQQGLAQGQTKLNEMQSAKSHDTLLRDLGAAYYAQQRTGGSAAAVDAAVEALDAHEAAAAAQPTPAPPTPPTPDAAAGGAASPTVSGSFGLDDI
jgi:hypothetical protein